MTVITEISKKKTVNDLARLNLIAQEFIQALKENFDGIQPELEISLIGYKFKDLTAEATDSIEEEIRDLTGPGTCFQMHTGTEERTNILFLRPSGADYTLKLKSKPVKFRIVTTEEMVED